MILKKKIETVNHILVSFSIVILYMRFPRIGMVAFKNIWVFYNRSETRNRITNRITNKDSQLVNPITNL